MKETTVFWISRGRTVASRDTDDYVKEKRDANGFAELLEGLEPGHFV